MPSQIKLLPIILFSLLSFGVLAETVEVHNMEEMLASVNLEKKQVEKMLEKLVKSGRLTPAEGELARREIASVKDSDLDQIKNDAIKSLSKRSN